MSAFLVVGIIAQRSVSIKLGEFAIVMATEIYFLFRPPYVIVKLDELGVYVLCVVYVGGRERAYFQFGNIL